MRLLQSSGARSRSLKLLHLRQSAPDFYVNWDASYFFDRTVELEDSGSDEGSGSDEVSEGYPLRQQLRRLAEWAFGPDGIPSLKVIACGDYAYGGRPPDFEHFEVILCRPEAGSEEGFRVLDRLDDESREEREEIIDAYRDFLEACPVGPLLIGHW